MKLNLKIVTLLIGFFLTNSALASECDKSCQKNLIDSYFERLGEVYKKGSKAEDIVNLFGLFSPEVRYEHIEYEANFNKQEWQVAFTENHKRGAYSAANNSVITVKNYIFGKSHVAIEYSYGEISETGDWVAKGDQNLLALFGFKGKKINLVREYW
ncbi:hypothetical protein [Teredinibacter waterburyi]|jgi:hypothetical protein|uniref:hypothetical protein n=1 Tax=Teredinibacter waterburyi TaxID=1500538 RepID=UPI00165F0240|nr:hypothetical protein [Teredinibacter waterburyi]